MTKKNNPNEEPKKKTRKPKNNPHAKGERCTAKSKRSGKPCNNPAVRGYKVCRMHGANPNNRGGAPEGSKNALKTGEHESIFFDCLDETEKELYFLQDLDKKKQLEDDLRLINIRIRRMLTRIHNLARKEFYISDITTGKQITKEDKDLVESGYSTNRVKKSTVDAINKVEEALTRVQAQKTKILEQIIRLDSEFEDKDQLTLQDMAKNKNAIVNLLMGGRNAESSNQ